jgi:hypothetical protein
MCSRSIINEYHFESSPVTSVVTYSFPRPSLIRRSSSIRRDSNTISIDIESNECPAPRISRRCADDCDKVTTTSLTYKSSDNLNTLNYNIRETIECRPPPPPCPPPRCIRRSVTNLSTIDTTTTTTTTTYEPAREIITYRFC